MSDLDPKVFERAAELILRKGGGMCYALFEVNSDEPDTFQSSYVYRVALKRALKPYGLRSNSYWGQPLGTEGRVIALLLMAELVRQGDLP